MILFQSIKTTHACHAILAMKIINVVARGPATGRGWHAVISVST